MGSNTEFSPFLQQKKLLHAWKRFIETGTIQESVVPHHIAESWKRSRAYGVDPFDYSRSACLDPAAYARRIADHQYLIYVARPFMEKIFPSLDPGRYLVLLFDPDGYHLLRMGRIADFERISCYHIEGGMCFEEEKVGTCGFSLVKSLNKPIQITGCEYYASYLHRIVGSYAPIRDPIHGSLLGVIGIVGAMTTPSNHTLGTVVATSTAIENYVKLDHSRRIFSLQGRSLQTMMDHLSDGIFLVDFEGRIAEINQTARQIFHLKKEEVKGRRLSDVPLIADMASLFTDALASRGQEEETDLQIHDDIYVTSIRRIESAPENGAGVLFQMRHFGTLCEVVQKRTADHSLISFDIKKPVQTLRRKEQNPTQITFDSMIGKSARMRDIRDRGRRAAQSDASVIIEGESGTGKEIFAQAVHNESRRKAAPFVIINCSAIPSELMESILFGHEQGAFTGARHTHIGKFELANGGTVFLDEIGEMPLGMQVKLLRALEERTIERIGGKKPINIDVRIIAATNRDLTEEILRGRFREDLFYRMNVFRIHLPPLRNRKEDIADLVTLFIQQFTAPFHKVVEKISPGYLASLINYPWPGNIRELRNAVEYSIAVLDGRILLEEHLSEFLPQPSAHSDSTTPEVEKGGGSRYRLAEMEEQVIHDALVATKNNKRKAAGLLGMSRATLYRRMKISGKVSLARAGGVHAKVSRKSPL